MRAPPVVPIRSTLFRLTCLAALCACLGCAKAGRKPVYPVRGQLLVEDKPAANAIVTFHPVGHTGPDAVHPVGHVDERGHFTLTSYETGDGAPEGEYQVTVTWYRATKARGRSGGGDEYDSRNYLPERYNRAETSQLRTTITRGENDLAPFRLKPR
jgi:hypothetical protein